MLGLVVLWAPFPKCSAVLGLDPPILCSPGLLGSSWPFEDQEVDKTRGQLLKGSGSGGTVARDGGA